MEQPCRGTTAAISASAYRGLCYSFTPDDPHWRFYQGKSPYMRPHAMVARRCPNQLGLTGGGHDIDGDANPACLIYELLTDDRWGIRLPFAERIVCDVMVFA